MIIKQLANLFLPDFMRIAHQNGTAMFNLDVDVSQELSSLFILREIVKHSKAHTTTHLVMMILLSHMY